MPAPTRVGWVAGSNSGASTLTLANPAGAQAGDRVVAFVSHTGAAATITDYQGWSLLSVLTFNTRRWHVLERAYAASYTSLSLSTAEGMLWATTAVRASSGYVLGSTVVGSTWRRVDNGGSINTTQASSVTAAANTLALAFFSETSTGAEVEADTSLSGSGWGKWFWSKAVAGDANPVNFLAFAEPAAGATGVATTTWLNNSNNGAGVQVLIPQTPTSVTVDGTGTLGLSGSAPRSVIVDRAASGALGLSGDAAASVSVTRSATGTLMASGASPRTVEVVRDGAGGLGLTGAAVPTVEVERPGDGLLELTGTATVTVEVIVAGNGDLALTGTGTIRGETPPWSDRLTLTATVDTLTLEATTPTLTLEAAW